jgi:agmatine/peptidylarginine deiminase
MFRTLVEWFYPPTVIDLVRQGRYQEASAYADNVAVLAAKNNDQWLFDQVAAEITETDVKTVWNSTSWGNLAAILTYSQDENVKNTVTARLTQALQWSA